ncbi:PHP domain-containing protein [Agrococcus sp. ARC_14]|uniref:PHP domain-containing protein n=1 Tax=Agrococcus sp. ARC_14 TaxID=2919927 RepID=UPI001F052160|nr:PHP domain-containing protein [Agrococcus sp. ARC_14]MCH1882623.1 PHP domain-containing protein [Agrococcus sp. ARC_14]
MEHVGAADTTAFDWAAAGPADLHLHSRESDGTDAPGDVVRAAAAAGLGVVALTDHDTVAGWGEASEVAREVGIGLLPGVEFSSQLGPASVHVLGYLLDPASEAFTGERERIRHDRIDRAERMVHAIGRDYPLTWQHIEQHSAPGATIGRPHIADALVALGIVPDRSAAFEGILHWQGGYYQPHMAPAPEEAIRIIHDAGGVSVLAHPGSRGRPVMRMGVLGDLVAAGLGGVEVWHRDNDAPSRRQLLADAERFGLLVTGSSDYHGSGKPNRLGEHTTEPAVVAEIVRRSTGWAPVLPA